METISFFGPVALGIIAIIILSIFFHFVPGLPHNTTSTLNVSILFSRCVNNILT
jgi:hypothetical protein